MKRRIAHVLKDRTRSPVKLRQTAKVKDAARLMRAENVGCVLVVDDEDPHRLRGIFTERDVLYKVVADGLDPTTTDLAPVMTPEPVTIRPDALGLEGLRIMEDAGFRHLPVVDQGRLIGVVSRRDFNASERGELEIEREYWEHIA